MPYTDGFTRHVGAMQRIEWTLSADGQKLRHRQIYASPDDINGRGIDVIYNDSVSTEASAGTLDNMYLIWSDSSGHGGEIPASAKNTDSPMRGYTFRFDAAITSAAPKKVYAALRIVDYEDGKIAHAVTSEPFEIDVLRSCLPDEITDAGGQMTRFIEGEKALARLVSGYQTAEDLRAANEIARVEAETARAEAFEQLQQQFITNQVATDVIYPVGSVVFGIPTFNPAEKFGGTWEQIADTYFFLGIAAFKRTA